MKSATSGSGRKKPKGLGGGLKSPQILAKVDLVPIDNNSKKIKGAKQYKPYKIPCKLLVTLLSFPVMHKANLTDIISFLVHLFSFYRDDYHMEKQCFIKPCLFHWGYKL